MANKTRAGKGGQHGVNGEFYEGGQFLPSSPTTQKGEFSVSSKKAKREIAQTNTIKINTKIDEVLANWYPNNTSAQARELFVRYLKDNGINTWSISPYGKDLEKWVL